MSEVKVKDNHLQYLGINYFRGGSGSQEIVLGSYGEKRTPVFGQNYLEVKGKIPPANIAKASSAIVEIDSSGSSKTDFSADVTAIVSGAPVKFSGAAAFEKIQKKELKLVLFSVMNNQMKSAVNKSSNALDNLKGYGGNARIAHKVFVVMEAKLATEFSKSGSLNISSASNGVKFSSNSSGKNTLVLPEGSCFAYLLAKIDWDMKLFKKQKVEDLNDDQWSMS